MTSAPRLRVPRSHSLSHHDTWGVEEKKCVHQIITQYIYEIVLLLKYVRV